MTLVINRSYGGFRLPDGFCRNYGYDPYEFIDRNDDTLVGYVLNHPRNAGDLHAVSIPDEATDWEILEYDGLESLIYVLNGKLHRAY